MRIAVVVAAVLVPDPLEQEVAAVADEDRQLDEMLTKQHAESDRNDANFNQWAASIAKDLGDVYGKAAQPRMEKAAGPSAAKTKAAPAKAAVAPAPAAHMRTGAAAKASSLLEEPYEPNPDDPVAEKAAEYPRGGLVPGNGLSTPTWMPGREKVKAFSEEMAADTHKFKERLSEDASDLKTRFDADQTKVKDSLKSLAAIRARAEADSRALGLGSSLLQTKDSTQPLGNGEGFLTAPPSWAPKQPKDHALPATYAAIDQRLEALEDQLHKQSHRIKPAHERS